MISVHAIKGLAAQHLNKAKGAKAILKHNSEALQRRTLCFVGSKREAAMQIMCLYGLCY